MLPQLCHKEACAEVRQGHIIYPQAPGGCVCGGGNKEVGTASFNYTVVRQTSGKCRPGCQTVIVVWIQVGRDGATVCSYRLSAFSLRRANTESFDLLLFLFTRGNRGAMHTEAGTPVCSLIMRFFLQKNA